MFVCMLSSYITSYKWCFFFAFVVYTIHVSREYRRHTNHETQIELLHASIHTNTCALLSLSLSLSSKLLLSGCITEPYYDSSGKGFFSIFNDQNWIFQFLIFFSPSDLNYKISANRMQKVFQVQAIFDWFYRIHSWHCPVMRVFEREKKCSSQKHRMVNKIIYHFSSFV